MFSFFHKNFFRRKKKKERRNRIRKGNILSLVYSFFYEKKILEFLFFRLSSFFFFIYLPLSFFLIRALFPLYSFAKQKIQFVLLCTMFLKKEEECVFSSCVTSRDRIELKERRERHTHSERERKNERESTRESVCEVSFWYFLNQRQKKKLIG